MKPRIFYKYFFALIVSSYSAGVCHSQTAEQLLQQVKNKLGKVNDYEANGKMKTNVEFIRAPIADITVFYKKPNLIRIVNQNGISFIPKGSVNISLNGI